MAQEAIGNITCIERSPNEKVDFHFNPTNYKVTKTVHYNPSANKGGNVPKMEPIGGSPRTISLELLFDSSMPRNEAGKPVKEQDVRTDVNKLFDFMLMDKEIKQRDGKYSHMSRPAMCRLQWGKDAKHAFPCYITQCDATYTLFNAAGVPIRAKVSLQLTEALDPAKQGGTNPTSRGEPGPKARRIQEGDRLDWIAFQEYGDPNEWRLIAQANRLSDPLNLHPGMVLAIPTR